jgi:beta propeller repeat protein
MSISTWRRLLVVVAASALLLGATAANASASVNAAGVSASALTPGPMIGTYGLERPLAIGALNQFYPSIYGDYVVYEEGPTDGTYANVKLYNMATNASGVICSSAGLHWRPRMWGNRIVWMDNRNGSWDIYWYDLTTSTEHRLTSRTGEEAWPEINGNRVVWQDSRNGAWDIYMYDFATGVETRITSDPSDQTMPRISGNRIVWQDVRDGKSEIYWYDIAAGAEYRLTSPDGTNKYEPDVNGTRAAWTIDTGTEYDVGFTSYFDKNGAVLWYVWAPAATNQTRPRVTSDGVVIFQSNESGKWTIGYNQIEQNTVYITDGTSNAYEPQIWGDTIVYFDDRNGVDQDLYATELARTKVTLTPAVTITPYGTVTKISGTLTKPNGSPLAARTVRVHYKLASEVLGVHHWTPFLTATTDVRGIFRVIVPAITGRFYAFAAYFGDSDAFIANSPMATVMVKASLTAPSAPSTVKHNVAFTSTGVLAPDHTIGSAAVSILCYRYERGKYRLKKTVTATMTTASTYSASVKLPSAGKWRLVASHSDSEHALTKSPTRSKTVK